MKIAIITDDFPPRSFGGAGIIASWQARELAKRGHEVSVITTVQQRDLEERITQEGYTIYRIYADYPKRWRDYISFYNPKALSRAEALLKDIKPDVAHIHNVHSFLSYHIFAIARHNAGAVFMTAHDTSAIHLGKLRPKVKTNKDGKRIFDYRVSLAELYRLYGLRVNPLRNFLVRYYLSKADKIFAVSAALAESLSQNGIKNVEVRHNGIDIENFRADSEEVERFKSEHSLHDKKVLFFGGRISRLKGGDVALDLLIELSHTMPEVCLLVVGEGGQYMKDLMSKANSVGVGDKVRFIKWLDRDKIACAYFASDIVLVPSLYLDPFPTVNLEAMAAKKPVIGTIFGGTPEAIKDNVNGFVLDPDDRKAVIEKTRALLEDEGLRKRFGEAGFELAKRQFSLFDQIDRLEKDYMYTYR